MADTAAHLVDRVFPRVPIRQWVLSFPHDLRYRLAYDASLVTDVLSIFTKTIFASLIERAREFGAVRKPQSGAVSFIQRFDSALRLNLHIHSLVIDGVYAADDDDKPQFQVLPAPGDEEIVRLTGLLAQRIRAFLQKRGLGADSNPEESDPLAREQPWLAGLYAASVRGRLGKFGTYGTVGILPSSVLNPPPVQNSLESPGLVYIIGYTATLPPLFEFPTFGSRFTRHVEFASIIIL